MERERHEEVKRDPAQWAALPLVGVQEPGTEHALELRNCTCCGDRPSTLAISVPWAP